MIPDEVDFFAAFLFAAAAASFDLSLP